MKNIENVQEVEPELIETIAYLISSANILPNEPPIYGPMRLLEGAKRLIEYLENKGIADQELLEIKEGIEKAINKVLTDEEAFKKGIDEVVKLMANYLKVYFL